MDFETIKTFNQAKQLIPMCDECDGLPFFHYDDPKLNDQHPNGFGCPVEALQVSFDSYIQESGTGLLAVACWAVAAIDRGYDKSAIVEAVEHVNHELLNNYVESVPDDYN